MADDMHHLFDGNRRALARAITLIESTLDTDREEAERLLDHVLPRTGKSIRIGISGAPGVGKSTFIEALGLHLISLGKRVAVLAVDPSSPVHGGSILGDKTRMEALSRAENAFIRPSPARGALGGVAQKTRETRLICEAAGYDVILVETVGVGQSEFEVADMVDFFLVLLIPNSGDEIQGMKKGILELADGLVINKADGENVEAAEISQGHYRQALQLIQHASFWSPRVLTCSAMENRGVQEVWDMVEEYRTQAEEYGIFQRKRALQNVNWMNKLVKEGLEARLRNTPAIRSVLPDLERSVLVGETTPYLAATRILELFQ